MGPVFSPVQLGAMMTTCDELCFKTLLNDAFPQLCTGENKAMGLCLTSYLCDSDRSAWKWASGCLQLGKRIRDFVAAEGAALGTETRMHYLAHILSVEPWIWFRDDGVSVQDPFIEAALPACLERERWEALLRSPEHLDTDLLRRHACEVAHLLFEMPVLASFDERRRVLVSILYLATCCDVGKCVAESCALVVISINMFLNKALLSIGVSTVQIPAPSVFAESMEKVIACISVHMALESLVAVSDKTRRVYIMLLNRCASLLSAQMTPSALQLIQRGWLDSRVASGALQLGVALESLRLVGNSGLLFFQHPRTRAPCDSGDVGPTPLTWAGARNHDELVWRLREGDAGTCRNMLCRWYIYNVSDMQERVPSESFYVSLFDHDMVDGMRERFRRDLSLLVLIKGLELQPPAKGRKFHVAVYGAVLRCLGAWREEWAWLPEWRPPLASNVAQSVDSPAKAVRDVIDEAEARMHRLPDVREGLRESLRNLWFGVINNPHMGAARPRPKDWPCCTEALMPGLCAGPSRLLRIVESTWAVHDQCYIGLLREVGRDMYDTDEPAAKRRRA